MKNILPYICPNLGIVASIMYMTFHLIDNANEAMKFIDHNMTTGLVAVLCVISIISSIHMLYVQSKNQKPSFVLQAIAFCAIALAVIYLLNFGPIRPFCASRVKKAHVFLLSISTIITSVAHNVRLIKK